MTLRAIPFILIVLGYAAFEVNSLRRSQRLFEPLFTFDQFVSARHAARRCGDPGPELRRDFDRNLDAVRVRARRELAETHSRRAIEEIEGMLSERERERERELDDLIGTAGCADPEVWKLVKLHEQRARLTIRAR